MAGRGLRSWLGDTEERSQSNVIAVVALVAIVAIGATTVVFFGSAAVDQSQGESSFSAVEESMQSLDATVEQSAAGQTGDTSVQFSDGGEYMRLDPSAGEITVEIKRPSSPDKSRTIPLGTVKYERDGQTVAYQGGGVWRQTGEGSVAVSPPDVSYRVDGSNGTLNFPIVTVDGATSGSEVNIQKVDTTSLLRSMGVSNPMKPGTEITIEVTSEFYQAWGETLEERVGPGTVSVDKGAQTVTVTFVNFAAQGRVTDAFQVIRGGGELIIQSGKKSVIQSYNSSTLASNRGPSNPPSATGAESDIVTDHDLRWKGNAQVKGNVTTTGKVKKLTGTGNTYDQIKGHLAYGKGTVSSTDCSDHVVKWCAKNASIDPIDDISPEINDAITELSSSNDNGKTSCLDETNGLTFGSCGSTIELEAGDYYLDNDLVVDGKKLLLNTTDGDIRIAVEDGHGVDISGGANVTVLGSGTARVYTDDSVKVQKSGTRVWNRGWDADQFWMLCSANCDVDINKGEPVYVGVIYAPSNSTATGAEVSIRNKAKIYGGVVGGGEAKLNNQADIFFDTSLKGAKVLAPPSIPQVTYLHMNVDEVTAEDN